MDRVIVCAVGRHAHGTTHIHSHIGTWLLCLTNKINLGYFNFVRIILVILSINKDVYYLNYCRYVPTNLQHVVTKHFMRKTPGQSTDT